MITNKGTKPVDNGMPASRRLKTKMTATAAHPYLKDGEPFEVHPAHVDGLIAKLWAVKAGEKPPSKDEAKNAAKPKNHSEVVNDVKATA